MITLADRMVADGHTPFSIVAASGPASGWALTDWISEIVLNNCGPDLYDQWIAAEIPWTDACIKQSFDMFADDRLRRRDTCSAAASGILATADDVGADPLYTDPPTAYLYYLASFAQAFIAANYPDLDPGDDYDVFTFPTIDPEYAGAVTIGADVPVMVSDTPAARSFMTYLASARAQEAWIKLGGFTSVNRSVSPDAYPDPVARAVAEELTDGRGQSLQRRRHDARVGAAGLVGRRCWTSSRTRARLRLDPRVTEWCGQGRQRSALRQR